MSILNHVYSTRIKLRGHRASSLVLTNSEIGELRAMQRTFEGAYVRLALSSMAFALIILKIFTPYFYPIGASYIAFSLLAVCCAFYRRTQSNDLYLNTGVFKTSGGTVVLMGVLAFCLQLGIIILLSTEN